MNVKPKSERAPKSWANDATLIAFLSFYYDEEQKRYWTEAARAARAEAPDCPKVKAGEWSVEDAPYGLLSLRMIRETRAGFQGVRPGTCQALIDHLISEVAWGEISAFFLEARSDSGRG